MAVMIPESISALENVTVGEKKVFKILKELLQDDYIVWFDLRVNNRYPDFIILAPDLGLIVLEVKDWQIGSIISADTNKFELKTMGKCSNPLKQARDYMFNIVNELKKDKKLVDGTGKYKGRLKFTYGHGVIFTKITKKSFEASPFKGTIEDNFIIFQDELKQIENSCSKDILKEKLEAMFPMKFDFERLDDKYINRIRGNIFKEVKLASDSEGIFKVMNLEQENYAKGLGYGHRVIRGVAGSGKTVILTCRAKYLMEVHKDWNIMVLCYNKTLAAFLREAINGNNKDTNVEIIHMHGWINKISKELGFSTALYDNQVTGNISKITDEMLEKLNKYDAILIDEGQDLEEEWLKFIVKNLRDPEHSHLLLASDGAQNLYSRKYTLKSVGIKAVGRTIIMRENYRNTKEILDFANGILLDGDNKKSSNADENDFIIEAKSILRRGSISKVTETKRFDDEIEKIIDQIIELNKDGVNYREIAILYPYGKYLGTEYVKTVEDALKKKSIPYVCINKAVNRANFKLNKNEVKISTIYSAKGLDFKAVFICGINQGLMKSYDESKKLLYVGMTRARDILNVTYSVNNELTEAMVKSHKQMIRNNGGEQIAKIGPKEIQVNKPKEKKKGFMDKIMALFR
ncbi:3'-5' exonuclease [Clostridium ganghwense]|uniref:NERD domain-containing protein n=1 Tax=Clostridium ganghwense TaxID=312089 RepID=A0ABT4CKH6_9CLOT|nr:nuclease-related domain-containing DEAD/DEAH box helicase [Clostridium ganghwense]MCY6369423.1 NERD domain-containing protein [Clostridium ganghwense]